jgi:hypothetical protein
MCGYRLDRPSLGSCQYDALWDCGSHRRCYVHAKSERPDLYMAVRQRPAWSLALWDEPITSSDDDSSDAELRRFVRWLSERPSEHEQVREDPDGALAVIGTWPTEARYRPAIAIGSGTGPGDGGSTGCEHTSLGPAAIPSLPARLLGE